MPEGLKVILVALQTPYGDAAAWMGVELEWIIPLAGV